MAIEGLDELNTEITETEDLTAEITEETDVSTLDQTDTVVVEDKVTDDVVEHSDINTEDNKVNSDDTKDDTPKDIDIKTLSGIEQYLAQFDIEGGMVDFKDGSRTHFSELPDDKQLDVLTKLHESSTKDVEAKFGLDEEEIGLINYMRGQEGTIDEVINNLAQQRANTYITAQEVKTANITDMDADAVYTSHLLKSNSEATTEQIEQDLETAKKMSNFDNIVSSLKADMIREQEANVAKQKEVSVNEMQTEIENQRKEVVDVVSKMDSIDGLSINDGIKNDVLDLILDVDDDGDSMFMTEVFSKPEQLFKAAFWYKNGQDIISSREDYWKKEKSAAYKRGQQDAQSGKRSFSSSDVKDKNKTTPHYSEPDETISFDDIYT